MQIGTVPESVPGTVGTVGTVGTQGKRLIVVRGNSAPDKSLAPRAADYGQSPPAKLPPP